MSRIMVTYAQGDTPTPREKWHIKRRDAVKLLIPAEFGGGAIHGIYSKDRYREYPEVTTASGEKYDALELLAYWNDHALQRMVIDRQLSTPEDVAARPADPAIDIIEEESSYFYISLPDGEVVVPPSTATEVISAAGMELAYDSEKKRDQQETLRYQMCIVPEESDLTYEECAYYSGITVDASDAEWITCVEGKVRDIMQDERATSGLYPTTEGFTGTSALPPARYAHIAYLLEIFQAHSREVSEMKAQAQVRYDPWGNTMSTYGDSWEQEFPPVT